MTRDAFIETPSRPAFSRSRSRGPCRFLRREYRIVTDEPDSDALRRALPALLEPRPGNLVTVQSDWEEGRRDLIPRGNGRVADLPVRRIVGRPAHDRRHHVALRAGAAR